MSMTEEQIRQNAENYVDSLRDDQDMGKYDYNDMEKSYIKGAHSRDKEIEELNKKLEVRRELLFQSTRRITELEMENNQLRNP